MTSLARSIGALLVLGGLAGCGCEGAPATTVHDAGVDGEAPSERDAALPSDAREPRHFLSVSVIGGGVLEIGGARCVRECDLELAHGERVELVPSADPGFALARFEGDCGGAACALEMDRDHVVSARFEATPSVLLGLAGPVTDIEALDDGGAWIAGGGEIAWRVGVYGEVVARVASPAIEVGALAVDGEGAWLVGTDEGGAFLVHVDGAGVAREPRIVTSDASADCSAIERTPDGGAIVGCAYGGTLQLRRFDASGELMWGRAFLTPRLGTAISPIAALRVAPDGDVMIAVTFEGAIGLVGTRLTTRGEADVAVARLRAADGDLVWSRRIGSAAGYPSIESATGLALTEDGDPVIVGLLSEGATLSGAEGDERGAVELAVPHAQSASVVRLSREDGSLVWARFPSSEFGVPVDVAVQGERLVVLSLERARGPVAERSIEGPALIALALDPGTGDERAMSTLPVDESGAGVEWGALALTGGDAVWLAAELWHDVTLGAVSVSSVDSDAVLARVIVDR